MKSELWYQQQHNTWTWFFRRKFLHSVCLIYVGRRPELNLINTGVCVQTVEWQWNCTHHLRLFNTQPSVKHSEMKTVNANFNLVLTCSWTTAAFWTAGAADVAAAGVWTALAPADPNQEQQQQEAQNHQNNQEPVCVGQQGYIRYINIYYLHPQSTRLEFAFLRRSNL